MEGVERKISQALPFDSHGEMGRYLTRAASPHILSILPPQAQEGGMSWGYLLLTSFWPQPSVDLSWSSWEHQALTL